ncbi:MAG TPA: hypothetical protein VIW07_07530 [Candidatus Udaeobacter sp.]
MNAERDAKRAFKEIKDYVAKARHPYRYVQVRLADYATEGDFHAFKTGQRWEVYKEATALLGKMCEEVRWRFENSDVITAASFAELAKQNGWVGDIGQKIDFILTTLGHEVHDGAHLGAYGVSPFVVLLSSEPTLLPQKTIHSGYVISN